MQLTYSDLNRVTDYPALVFAFSFIVLWLSTRLGAAGPSGKDAPWMRGSAMTSAASWYPR